LKKRERSRKRTVGLLSAKWCKAKEVRKRSAREKDSTTEGKTRKRSRGVAVERTASRNVQQLVPKAKQKNPLRGDGGGKRGLRGRPEVKRGRRKGKEGPKQTQATTCCFLGCAEEGKRSAHVQEKERGADAEGGTGARCTNGAKSTKSLPQRNDRESDGF